METERALVGFILLVFGGLNVVRPDILMHLNIWIQKNIMGAVYEPSGRTYKIVRAFGVILVILGLLNLV